MDSEDLMLLEAACRLALGGNLIGSVCFWERLPESVEEFDALLLSLGLKKVGRRGVLLSGRPQEVHGLISVDFIVRQRLVSVFVTSVAATWTPDGGTLCSRETLVIQRYNKAETDQTFTWAMDDTRLDPVPGKTKEPDAIRYLYCMPKA